MEIPGNAFPAIATTLRDLVTSLGRPASAREMPGNTFPRVATTSGRPLIGRAIPGNTFPRVSSVSGNFPTASGSAPRAAAPSTSALKMRGNTLPSNAMPVQSKLEKMTTARNVIAGLKKRFGSVPFMMVSGKKYKPAEVIAFYERHLAAIEDVRKKWAAWQLALRAERAMRKPAIAMTLGLKASVSNRFGFDAYADFGWSRPKKPGPKTVQAKLAGVEKRAKKRQAP